MINPAQNHHSSENKGPSTLTYEAPYSQHAATNTANIVPTMDDATFTTHSSAASAPLLSLSSHQSAPLPLRRPQASIALANVQHSVRHNTPNQSGRPLHQGAPTPTIMLTHPTTTLSLHKATIKTTEKSSTLLYNLHGDYHHTPTNHHHHISPLRPAPSSHRSTTDPASIVAPHTHSNTPLHPKTTITQGTSTSSTSNPQPPFTSHRSELLTQCHRPLDITVSTALTTTVLLPTAPPASLPNTNRIQPTEFSFPLDSPVKKPNTTPASILDSVDTGDSFDERMRQQQRCFLATLADLWHNLVLAQQAFETQLQSFLAHRNAMQTSQPLNPSTNSPNHCNLPLTALRSIPEQDIHHSVDFLDDTWRYPSPLNTQFLLPSGNYNNAATGVHWFKSSLFFLLPFLQRTKVTPTFEIRTAPSAYFRHTQTATNITGSRSRPYVPATTEQVRPKFLPNAHSNTPYSILPQCDQLQYQNERTTTTLPPSHKDGGPTYRPPWPPPQDSSGCPAISHSVDFKPGHYWPTNYDQSGHLGLITWPPTVYSTHNPQAYCFDHRRPPLPPQYRILSLHCVSLPTSMTEDKNLLRPP